MAKVSIIIPVYNAEKYIRECLDSIVSQTFKDFEVIVVNDASSDHSVEIIKEYCSRDSRFLLISNAVHSNAGTCRNIGFEYVRGQYCIFLDADDFFHGSMLQKIVERAENVGTDITAFNYFKYDDKLKRIVDRDGIRQQFIPEGLEIFNYNNVPGRILDVIAPVPWNKLYKVSFLKKGKIKFLDISTSNDITFASSSLCLANSITYLDEPLLFYRTNIQGSISSLKADRLDNVVRAVEAVHEQISVLSYFKDIEKSLKYFLVNKYLHHLSMYRSLNNFNKVKKIFHSELLNSIKKEDLDNNSLYWQYCLVKNKRYFSYSFFMKPIPRIVREFSMHFKENGFISTVKRSLSYLHKDGNSDRKNRFKRF